MTAIREGIKAWLAGIKNPEAAWDDFIKQVAEVRNNVEEGDAENKKRIYQELHSERFLRHRFPLSLKTSIVRETIAKRREKFLQELKNR